MSSVCFPDSSYRRFKGKGSSLALMVSGFRALGLTLCGFLRFTGGKRLQMAGGARGWYNSEAVTAATVNHFCPQNMSGLWTLGFRS